MPIHHYSPLDSLPPPSRWFRDNMKAIPRDKPVTRVIQVRAVSPFPDTLVYQGCEPPPENAPSPPPQQGTPAERVLSLMDLSLPPVQSSSRGRRRSQRKGTKPPEFVSTALHTPGRAGQRKGAKTSGLIPIIHTPSRAKFFTPRYRQCTPSTPCPPGHPSLPWTISGHWFSGEFLPHQTIIVGFGHRSQTGPKKCFIPQYCEKYTNFVWTEHSL